ncbi:hypothetical protein Tco_0226124 [Tanacetum coccineum]
MTNRLRPIMRRQQLTLRLNQWYPSLFSKTLLSRAADDISWCSISVWTSIHANVHGIISRNATQSQLQATTITTLIHYPNLQLQHGFIRVASALRRIGGDFDDDKGTGGKLRRKGKQRLSKASPWVGLLQPPTDSSSTTRQAHQELLSSIFFLGDRPELLIYAQAPPPPQITVSSTRQEDQSTGTAAPNSSKTAASAECSAWTTTNSQTKPQNLWKPLTEDRLSTPEPAWTIPSSDLYMPTNNWASALNEDSSELTPKDPGRPVIQKSIKVLHPGRDSSPNSNGRMPQTSVQIKSDDAIISSKLRHQATPLGEARPLSISKMKSAYYPKLIGTTGAMISYWIAEEWQDDIAEQCYGILVLVVQRQRFNIDAISHLNDTADHIGNILQGQSHPKTGKRYEGSDNMKGLWKYTSTVMATLQQIERSNGLSSQGIQINILIHVTNRFTLIVLSTLRRSDTENRSVLTDPEDQAKMEMETPHSSGVNSPPNAHT